MSGRITGRSRGRRKEMVGTVVSDAMTKTRVVQVERRYRHGLYGKEIFDRAKFHAHDEKEVSRQGDRVRLVETRPVSRLKRWRVAEVLSRGGRTPAEEGKA